MFLFDWLNEYLEYKREAKLCQSCQTLKEQLALANQEKELLLNKLLERTNPAPVIEKKIDTSELKPLRTSQFVSNRVRRQMLQNEDRDAARKLAEFRKQSATVETMEQTIEQAVVGEDA